MVSEFCKFNYRWGEFSRLMKAHALVNEIGTA